MTANWEEMKEAPENARLLQVMQSEIVILQKEIKEGEKKEADKIHAEAEKIFKWIIKSLKKMKSTGFVLDNLVLDSWSNGCRLFIPGEVAEIYSSKLSKQEVFEAIELLAKLTTAGGCRCQQQAVRLYYADYHRYTVEVDF